MNVKFLQNCQDKHTGQCYTAGEVVSFDEARGNEVIATGFAEKIEERKLKANKNVEEDV